MIWRYRVPTAGGSTRYAYGIPAEVACYGKRMRLVYQLQGAETDQGCAVVHFPSGVILAFVREEHVRGSIPEQAQAAMDARLRHVPEEVFWRRLGEAKTINVVPEVF